MTEFAHEVGDEFEGSPSELSRYISKITAAGGTFRFTGGRKLEITSLPEKEGEAKSGTAKEGEEKPIRLSKEDSSDNKPSEYDKEAAGTKDTKSNEETSKTEPKPRGRKPKAFEVKSSKEVGNNA